jgi:hypothetical protein
MEAAWRRLVARASGTSPANWGMAAVRPGCNTLSAIPKQSTNRTVEVND